MKIKLFKRSLVEKKHKAPNMPAFRITKNHIIMCNNLDKDYRQFFYIDPLFGILGILYKSYYR